MPEKEVVIPKIVDSNLKAIIQDWAMRNMPQPLRWMELYLGPRALMSGSSVEVENWGQNIIRIRVERNGVSDRFDIDIQNIEKRLDARWKRCQCGSYMGMGFRIPELDMSGKPRCGCQKRLSLSTEGV